MNIFKKKPKPYVPQVSVTMPDGTIEEYPKHFIITDKVNCVSCGGEFYHYCLDCECLEWELGKSDGIIRGMTIKDAKKEGKSVCGDCDRNLYLYNHGRAEEMR